MPTVQTAHMNIRVDDEEMAPRTVPVHDFHNGGRVPTGDVLLILDERLGLGVTLSGRPEALVDYLASAIAAIRATQTPLVEVA